MVKKTKAQHQSEYLEISLSTENSLVAADDLELLILKASSGFEQLADIQPEMFEDVLNSDEQLAKFDKFLVEVGEIERKQNDILEDIQVS